MEEDQLERLEQMVDMQHTALNNWISEKESEIDQETAKFYEAQQQILEKPLVSPTSKIPDESKEEETCSDTSLIKAY